MAEVDGEDVFRGGVVIRYVGSDGWLWVVEFGQHGDDGNCLLAADEDAACFCFGCEGKYVLQGFANNVDSSVEWRASGVSVAEVEDADDAAACLG